MKTNKINYYKDAIYKEASLKRDDKKRETDRETRLWRDRIKPELKRSVKAIPLTVAGAGAGALGGTAISKLNKKISPEKAMSVTQHLTGAGLIAGSSGSHYMQDKKEYKRLSNKYLGEDPSKKDNRKIALKTGGSFIAGNLNPVAGAVGSVLSTPEAMVQKKRREAMEEAFRKNREGK